METNEIIETQFHCDIFWHLDGLSLRIYLLASKIAYESGKFFASIGNLADYFDAGYSTVSEHLKHLTKEGFLEIVEQMPFRPTVYRVISHDEWASLHLKQCCQKETFPWTDDPLVDPLAQKFHSFSGGQIKFRENDMRGLQKLNLADEILVQDFSDYFEKTWPYCIKSQRAAFNFSGRFVKYMKQKYTKLAQPTNPLKGRAKLLYETQKDEMRNELAVAETVPYGG